MMMMMMMMGRDALPFFWRNTSQFQSDFAYSLFRLTFSKLVISCGFIFAWTEYCSLPAKYFFFNHILMMCKIFVCICREKIKSRFPRYISLKLNMISNFLCRISNCCH